MVRLPSPRGRLSEHLVTVLAGEVGNVGPPPAPAPADALSDDDLHLALYLCYELHYRGLPGVDDAWEWEPSLLAWRGSLERTFEAGLRDVLGEPSEAPAAEDVDIAVRAIAETDDAPSLSVYLEREGTLGQVLEFVVHRSAYHLKEADPHTWAIPRLSGPPKAALIEVQADEYGGGRADRIHAELFGRTMEELGLDRRYGAYVNEIPGVTLATVNLMSMFGLHRRWRGAIVGHLALFEMTSAIPNRRYGNALRRLGFGQTTTDFFDEHVTADAVHESIAAVDLAGGLIRQEPARGADILWGARALEAVDRRWSRHLLDAWRDERSSLLVPLPAATPA